MNFTKIIIYIITYLILGSVTYKLGLSSYIAITHLNWYVANPWELNIIWSFILELTIFSIVIFTFFIPISRKKDNSWKQEKNNIYYLMESMSESINNLIEKWWDSKNVRQSAINVFLFNFVLYITIIVVYAFIIINLAKETNWVKAIVILLVSMIIVSLLDKINYIIRTLDTAEMNNVSWTKTTDIASKKNIITWITILFLLFFWMYFNTIINFIYWLIHNWLPFLDLLRVK